ncbi:MAG: hypothetical protein AABX47_03935 [Nanoarchaeota archaeon]
MRQPLRTNKKGQLADLGVDTISIINLLLINLTMYGIYAISAVDIVEVRGRTTSIIDGAAANPYIGTTLSVYMRTPLPDQFEQRAAGEDDRVKDNGDFAASTKVSADTWKFLSDNPEIWKGRTYGEFLSLLATTQYLDNARLALTFKEVSEATFARAPPNQKTLLFEYDLSDPASKVVSVDIGSEGLLQPEEERTASAPVPILWQGKAKISLYIPKETMVTK